MFTAIGVVIIGCALVGAFVAGVKVSSDVARQRAEDAAHDGFTS